MCIYHSAALRGIRLLRLLPLVTGLGFASAIPSSSFTEGPPADASAAVDADSSCFEEVFATFLAWLSSVFSWGFGPFSSTTFLGRPRFLGGCGGISSPTVSAFSFEEEAEEDFFFAFPIWWRFSSVLWNKSSKRFRRGLQYRVPWIQSFQFVYRCIQLFSYVQGNHERLISIFADQIWTKPTGFTGPLMEKIVTDDEYRSERVW